MSTKILIVTIPKEKGLEDPFFRYKRNVITKLSYIGKNGGCTVVDGKSLSELCHAIGRERAWLIPHLKRIMNCTITEEKGKNIKHPSITIKGEVSYQQLDDAVEKTISKHILCRECENCETFDVDEGGRRCKACGFLSK